MTERKELGRIQSATFGYGGYQDVQFGLAVALSGEGWGVGDFKGAWGTARSEHAKWTEEDRLQELGKTCLFLRDTLKAARRQHVAELAGTPVEVTFDGNKLVSWRVLTEVLA